MDEKSYQGIYVGYEGTNQYRVYNSPTSSISVTQNSYFDKVYTYDNKRLQTELAAQALKQNDDELFPDLTDIK